MEFLTESIEITKSNWINTICVLLALYTSRFYYRYFTRPDKCPGPIPLPFVGNLFQLLKIEKIHRGLHRRYGDVFEMYMGGERYIFFNCGGDNLFDKIASSSTKTNYFNRVSTNENLEDLGFEKNGLVANRDPRNWRRNRKILSHIIMSTKFLHGLVMKCQDLFLEAEGYWAQLGHNTELDYSKWSTHFVTDITIELAIGERAYSLASYYNMLCSTFFKSNNKEEIAEFPTSLINHAEEFNKNIMQWPISLFYIASIPSWMRHYVPVFSHFDRKCKRNFTWMKNEMESMIAKRQKETNDNNEKSLAKTDLLTLLMTNSVEDDNKTASSFMEETSQTVIEVCAAGIDTTAATFCFLIYLLDRNPHVKEELLKEFESVLGQDIYRPCTYADLGKMQYCEAVVKETLRLIPPVPFIPKFANEDDEINQYKIKAGTTIWLNVQQAHASDWTDPAEFDPSRFLKDSFSSETDKYSMKNFVPFGVGVRKCPGILMAITELKTLTVLLYRKYDVKLAGQSKELNASYAGITQCHDLKLDAKMDAQIGELKGLIGGQ
ncbi:4265_t:CDS:2, partial [Ambispora gerdemannii]